MFGFFFVMLFQYLNCVFNIQSQHGIWKMLQHLLPNTDKMDSSWLTFFILPSSSSEACIAEYVRIPSYKYEYVYTQWRIFFRDSSKLCIAWSIILASDSYWMLEILVTSCSGLVMQAKGEGALGQQFGWTMRLRTESRSQNTPCKSIFHVILRIIRIPCRFIS